MNAGIPAASHAGSLASTCQAAVLPETGVMAGLPFCRADRDSKR